LNLQLQSPFPVVSILVSIIIIIIMTSTKSITETVNDIHTWLLTTGLDHTTQHNFVEGYCSKLRELGLPVDRFLCGATVLHPLVAAKSWKWIDGIVTEFSWSRLQMKKQQETFFGKEDSPTDAPMVRLMKGAPFVRIRSTDEVIPEDIDWMKEENYTDLFGLGTSNTGQGNLEGGFTWSTKAPGGFTDDQIEFFQKHLLSLAAALRMQAMKFTSLALLTTYLGEDAGKRVHRGEISRGEGLVIRSVIWFSDIRGFTKMSGELNRTELVCLINGVFEVTAQVIKAHKGQVLKFMGDGLMAIFSTASRTFQRHSFSADEKRDVDEQEAASMCHAARLAAAALQMELAKLREERQAKGLQGASVGVGLHYGDVSYGNIGSEERLDFTVLGSHVNVASRTESLCGKLGAQVLCTSDFAKFDDDVDAWSSRGEHEVKGVADPIHVYELSECAASTTNGT
jgi:adenylate cyclase